MKIAVWDTYVQKPDNTFMHFDILVPDSISDKEQIVNYGNAYLNSKALSLKISSTDHCAFCHVETPDAHTLEQVKNNGFAILEMENCH